MIQLEEFEGRGVRHAFFTRRGGVSTGIYHSLNCGLGSDDDPNAVRANRARAMAALDLPAEALVTCHQYHSAEVAVIDAGALPAEPPKVDALVTTSPDLALGIMTADCGPVLFADTTDKVVGAAHAGWRGALGGVLEATVDAMIDQGARADNIIAAIGPMIGPSSYEVGPEFPAPFLEQEAGNGAFFRAAEREGHYLFNLPGYIGARLARLGLGDILRLDGDTYRDPANFFSYRRSTHRGEPDYGRMLSTIALET
ncbi:MAG: peptidoglycan editing factor PgeF [Alphaproteobacteria bacterium]|nr:peptidoglycan editing factor PgeF [Alphaproteobacteria bacterium]